LCQLLRNVHIYKTGRTMTYDEFGNELKTAQNASFKYLAYVDKLIET
jgi:hypothetical protein